MKKLFFVLSFVILALGCTSAPVLNYENTPIPNHLTLEQIKETIVNTTRATGWTIIDEKKGLVTASIVSRGHKATVDITYNKEAYSIHLKSSEGLEQEGNTIHRNYNRWSKRLHQNILGKLKNL